MIEIVYEKEKQKSEGNESFFRIPNNIRQIGEVGGIQKIYIEDYAYTYLCRISSENSHFTYLPYIIRNAEIPFIPLGLLFLFLINDFYHFTFTPFWRKG